MRISMRTTAVAIAAAGTVLASTGGAMAASAQPSTITPMQAGHLCSSDAGGWAIIKDNNGFRCFGGRGTQYFQPADPSATNFCAGDNWGYLTYDGNNKKYFSPYQQFSVATYELASITITDYTTDQSSCSGSW